MRIALVLSLCLGACSAQYIRGTSAPVDASVDAVSLCTPGAQVACACPGGVQGVQACTAGGTYGPCGCADAGSIPDASRPDAYEACTAGQSCGGGTLCASVDYTALGGAASLCTTTCSIGTQCPASGTTTTSLPTCVVNGSTGLGQCYATCASNFDCGARTQCARIPGTANQVCVPIGSGAVTQPPLPAAYTGCTPAGGACGSSTTCTPSTFTRAGAAQGNLCTIACASGNAAMCPGYNPGAAIQQVECVAPTGNPNAAQCMRLCDPANADRDCAPFFTTCAAVQMTAGTLNVCVP